MKKILSLLMIMLALTSASFASPGLVLSEGNIDDLAIYSPDGTLIDSMSEVSETGMVIRTADESVAFTSDYGTIRLNGNSLLAVTGYDLSLPSLYLLYGEMDIATAGDLQLTVYTPVTSTLLPGSGEYSFITSDNEEIFSNYSSHSVTAFDGIRGIYEEVGPMETLNYLAWPRKEAIPASAETSEEQIPQAPVIGNPEIGVSLPSPTIIDITRETRIPASPSIGEPSVEVSKEPTLIEIGKETIPAAEITESAEIAEPAETTEPAVVTEPVTEEPETAVTEPIEITEPAVVTEPETEEPETAVTEAAETAVEEKPAALPDVAPITPPAVTEKDESIFDIRLGGRVYGSQNGTENINAYIQPSLSIGSFTLTLNIDPFAIISGIESESVTDWIGFASDFIDEISYYGDSVLLAIDRTSYLPGDTAGLFTGLNHNYDGAFPALSLNHTFTSEYYGHRIWFDDLSFRNAGDNSGNGGLELTIRTGDSYPLAITFGGAVNFNPEALSVDLYPEASIYIPMMWGDFNLGLKASAATAYFDDYTVNPFTENGMLIAAAIPFSFSGFTFELGGAWSTENMHYGMLGNTLYTPASGNYVTLRALAEYRSNIFGVRAEGWMDIDLGSSSISTTNSYADASAYLNLYGLSLFGGIRAQIYEAAADMEYYGGIGTDLGPLDSKLMMSYNAEDGFALTFASSVSMFGRNREKASGFSGHLPLTAEIETGFEYLVTDGETSPVFTVTPKVFIGNEDYSIALRAPIRMTYADSRFILGGFNGYESWDFGTTESDEDMRIYRAVTDSFALIEGIDLGDPASSLAYLNAERGYRKNGTLFSNYGDEDALALRLGFNFPNLSLAVYADNAEAPHIVEGGIVFYPGEFGGPSISITLPGEVLMTSSFLDYALLFYPEFRVSVPFADNYEISVYASGEISTVYQNGEMVDSNIIYDFGAGAMNDYMAGLQFRMDLGTVALSVDGGIRNNGRLAPYIFTELSSAMNDTAGTLSEIAAREGNNDLKYYAAASIALDFDFIGFEATYSVNDLLGYAAEPGDYLSLAIGGNINDEVKLYASFAKDNLTSSFRNSLPFMDYITTDALFSVGADFSFSRVGFTAELQSSFDNGTSEYINVPAHKDQADVRLMMKARLSF